MTHIGFTGTRRGMTGKQAGAVWDVLADAFSAGDVTFHHGDCVGADAQAHEMARALGIPIVLLRIRDPKAHSTPEQQEIVHRARRLV